MKNPAQTANSHEEWMLEGEILQAKAFSRPPTFPACRFPPPSGLIVVGQTAGKAGRLGRPVGGEKSDTIFPGRWGRSVGGEELPSEELLVAVFGLGHTNK